MYTCRSLAQQPARVRRHDYKQPPAEMLVDAPRGASATLSNCGDTLAALGTKRPPETAAWPGRNSLGYGHNPRARRPSRGRSRRSAAKSCPRLGAWMLFTGQMIVGGAGRLRYGRSPGASRRGRSTLHKRSVGEPAEGSLLRWGPSGPDLQPRNYLTIRCLGGPSTPPRASPSAPAPSSARRRTNPKPLANPAD